MKRAGVADPVLQLLTDAIGSAPSRCSYVEARHVATDSQDVLVRNGAVHGVDSVSASGVGVRVRVGGGWGFAATRDVSAKAIEDALARALAIAESQPAAPPAPLTPVEPARGDWRCTYTLDPLAVSLEDKLELLLSAPSLDVAAEHDLEPERVRLLPAALSLLAALGERLDCPLTIGDGGLREGVCIELSAQA